MLSSFVVICPASVRIKTLSRPFRETQGLTLNDPFNRQKP